MRVEDFDFDLPRGLIASHPCEPRDAARLLFIPASSRFENKQVADLPALLRPGSPAC
jgi:S-adenosylmethionine:tRNA ribosyltransferase-isomerase